jgi:AraC family transcriptional regulator, regulatory protein of adaptative response / methylated-DNA-[protein]-cysteine methyltransferase
MNWLCAEHPALSRRQTTLESFLDLRASTGVQTSASPNIFDHEDRSGSQTMNLMISEAALRLSPAAKQANAAVEILFHATGECALGKVLVARSAKGVCAILLGAGSDELEADLADRFPEAMLIANEAIVRDDQAKVIRFVDKPAEGLHLALDMRGTPLQRRVWEKMRSIPVGRTVTYMELARWISSPLAARVIAGACAANPIALAIPCHRVIRTDGDLAGYRWGIERKRELIRKEALT